jgi:hypothetical protein
LSRELSEQYPGNVLFASEYAKATSLSIPAALVRKFISVSGEVFGIRACSLRRTCIVKASTLLPKREQFNFGGHQRLG